MVQQVMAQSHTNYDLALACLSRHGWDISAALAASANVGVSSSQSSRRRRALPRRGPSNSDSN